MNHRLLLVGNWKMNPSTVSEAKKIARKVRRVAIELEHTDVIMCPPFPFIASCSSRSAAKRVYMGAQSASVEESTGAFTGEVSAIMLRDLGVQYVIIGHSEQRKRGDTDEVVARRMNAVLSAGMTPILCVGEEKRDENGDYLEGLGAQIKASCADLVKKYAKSIIIAYEPVWAIGAQEAMKPEDMYETSIFIKKILADMYGSSTGLKATVLYGGSVNFRNAPDMIRVGKVDGLLVGRESVNSAGFVELMKAVDQVVV